MTDLVIMLSRIADQRQGFLESPDKIQRGSSIIIVNIWGGSLSLGTLLLGQGAVFQEIVLGSPDIGGRNVAGFVFAATCRGETEIWRLS